MVKAAGFKRSKACLRRVYRRGEAAFYSLPCPAAPSLARRSGQSTVEYLLMLAVVAAMATMMGVLFHKKILGGVFTMVGLIIGAGQPTP